MAETPDDLDSALLAEQDRLGLPELLASRRAEVEALAPPVFHLDLDWPALVPGSVDGLHAWTVLCDALRNETPATPTVTAAAWDKIQVEELIRRAFLARGAAENPEVAIADRILSRSPNGFWHWIGDHGWIENPHRRGAFKLPLVLWPAQVALLLWMQDHLAGADEQDTRLVNKSRSVGLSWLAMHLFGWHGMVSPGFSCLCGSIGEDEADNGTTQSLLGKLRFILDQQPAHLLSPDEWSTKHLEVMVCDNLIKAETMNEHFARSGRFRVMFLDERASVQHRLQRLTNSSTTSVYDRLFLVSTPRGRDNDFYSRAINLPREASIRCHWSVDPRRALPWYERLLIKNGGGLTPSERSREYAGVFDALREWGVYSNAEGIAYDDDDPEFRYLAGELRGHGQLVAGMDFGGNLSACVLRLGLVDWIGAKKLGGEWYPRFWWDYEVHEHNLAPRAFGAECKEALAIYHRQPCGIFIDPTAGAEVMGEGTSWKQAMQAAGLQVTLAHTRANLASEKDATIKIVDMLMGNGLWRVHSRRAPHALKSDREWERDIPPGVPIQLLSRLRQKPKKDEPSHSAEASLYATYEYMRRFAGVMRQSKAIEERRRAA
jgi:hypothetical protein